MASATSEFDAYWPCWPKGTEGESLARVYLGCGVENLVEFLWANDSQFQSDVDSARGFVDYVASPWTTDVNELPSLPGGFDWVMDSTTRSTSSTSQPQKEVQTSSDEVNYSGKMRKVRYDSQGGAAFLGQFFKNEELQRCREHIPHVRMVMEASVCTTAPYCDRIRVLCQYTLEAVTKTSSLLKIEFHIAYVKNVNGMTKVFMERGARGGLQKNFEIYIQVLERFAPILSDEEQAKEPVVASPEVPCPDGDEIVSTSRKPLINWQSLAFPDLSYCLERALPHFSNAGPGNRLSSYFPSRRLAAQIFSFACFLLVAQIIMTIICLVKTMLPTAIVSGSILQPFLHLMDSPDTLGELLSAALLLEFAHWTLNYLTNSAARIGSWDTKTSRTQAEAPSDNVSSKIKTEPLEASIPNSPFGKASRTSRESNATSLTSQYQQSPGFAQSAKIHRNSSSEPLLKSETSADVLDEPSLIDNTVSFFKLGMVTAALGVELALSGISRTLQHTNVPSETSQEEDAVSVDGNDCNSRTVLEDVFENERFQPFRGWGHAWPGHFLPTDKCGYWSTHNSSHEILATSMVFDDVAPQLPNGWRWIDADWQVDLTGQDVEAVDKDGWQYGVDFSWLHFPSEAGRGKNVNLKLVRRRRWTRTRTRLDAGVPPTESALSSLQPDAPDFLQPKLTEVMARFTAEQTDHKARSERSYFAEGQSTLGFNSQLQHSVGDFVEAKPEQLHRRNSLGCALERYFSIEPSCDSSKQHSFDANIQACVQNNKRLCPDRTGSSLDEDDHFQSIEAHEQGGSLSKIPSRGHIAQDPADGATIRTAWSDSEIVPQKRTNDHWLWRNRSTEFQRKQSGCNSKRAHHQAVAAVNNTNCSEDQPCPSLTDTESYASYDPNWACLEGSKWVNEFKSPRKCGARSPNISQGFS